MSGTDAHQRPVARLDRRDRGTAIQLRAVEARPRPSRPGGAHHRARSRGVIEPIRCTGWDQQPLDAVGHQLRDATDSGRDHGESQAQRLHERDREALEARRQHEDIATGQHPSRVIAPPEQRYPRTEAELLLELADPASSGPWPIRTNRGRGDRSRTRAVAWSSVG